MLLCSYGIFPLRLANKRLVRDLRSVVLSASPAANSKSVLQARKACGVRGLGGLVEVGLEFVSFGEVFWGGCTNRTLGRE